MNVKCESRYLRLGSSSWFILSLDTYIVKGVGVGVGIVLEEEARDGSVFDLVTVGNFLPGHGAGGERQGNRQHGGLHLDGA